MLYLICVPFVGDVEIRDFGDRSERSHFSDTLDRQDYRHIIEVNGSFNMIECRGCDSGWRGLCRS